MNTEAAIRQLQTQVADLALIVKTQARLIEVLMEIEQEKRRRNRGLAPGQLPEV